MHVCTHSCICSRWGHVHTNAHTHVRGYMQQNLLHHLLVVQMQKFVCMYPQKQICTHTHIHRRTCSWVPKTVTVRRGNWPCWCKEWWAPCLAQQAASRHRQLIDSMQINGCVYAPVDRLKNACVCMCSLKCVCMYVLFDIRVHVNVYVFMLYARIHTQALAAYIRSLIWIRTYM